ncbi:MAG TPA: hypothetical protein VF527_11490 [Pyrinomonadaceae bacterium]|jgi:hypothetical protein
MSRLRLASRSVASAVILMSLSQLFSGSGGDFIAIPGMIAEALVTVVIMVLSMILSEPDYYRLVGFAFPFNLIFYSTSFYAVLWLWVCLKGSHTGASVDAEAVN